MGAMPNLEAYGSSCSTPILEPPFSFLLIPRLSNLCNLSRPGHFYKQLHLSTNDVCNSWFLLCLIVSPSASIIRRIDVLSSICIAGAPTCVLAVTVTDCVDSRFVGTVISSKASIVLDRLSAANLGVAKFLAVVALHLGPCDILALTTEDIFEESHS